jgi:hypothetical protein
MILNKCYMLCFLACANCLLPAQARIDYIFDCGVLQDDPGSGCILFRPTSGGQFVLSDYGGFGSGDTVFVDAAVLPDCDLCKGQFLCLQTFRVDSCEYRDLGCGTVFLAEFDCPSLFYPDAGGIFNLGETGGFSSGDSIQVLGWVSPPGDPSIPCNYDYVVVDTLLSCKSPAPSRVLNWGRLKVVFR